jgi:transcriptional regulator with GAF, ATPase, and Fis domain
MKVSARSSGLSTDHYNGFDMGRGLGSSCDHDDEWIPLNALSAHAESFAGMVVGSDALRRLVSRITQLAPYKATVLIQGESGAGKELVAEALHKFGPMPHGPFVVINCSNLVGSLAEAQLFGHVRGAFTDAREDSLGYFRSANGGTLFLDEIGELPLSLQPKLLRVVESHEVQPVGSAKSYKVDVRLVAATNRDLLGMIKKGEFRADLYYRLNGSLVAVPPLRERRDGIASLVAHFVECYNRLFEKEIAFISRRAIELLETADWPGNIRQLANTLQTAVMLSSSTRLCVADFSDLGAIRGDSDDLVETAPRNNEPVPESGVEPPMFRQAVDLASRRALLRALQQTGGNCSRTARLLGVSRPTVYRLISRHGLARRGAQLSAQE